MPYFDQSIIFKFPNEHDLEHAMNIKRQFSKPKIYIANGDLTKRWYVYFSFRNPQTGKMDRMKNIYGIANSYKTKEQRLQVLTAYRINLLKLLKLGFSPFKDNSELYKSCQEKDSLKKTGLQKGEKQTKVVARKEAQFNDQKAEEVHKSPSESSLSIKDAFDFAIKVKSKVISERTLNDYRSKVKRFLKWLNYKYPEVIEVVQLSRKLCIEFLNEILEKSSSRNRNNYRTELSSIFQVLLDNEIIELNYFQSIKKLRTIPKVHKAFSEELLEKIYRHLKQEDPIFYLYIQFISIAIMRPIEVCRLRVGDLDLKERLIKFKAKNSPLKTKIIPELLYNQLPDLSNKDKNLLLFTPKEIGGEWNTSENNRRGYFSALFHTKVRKPFQLPSQYTLYGFRHTYISILYKSLRKTTTPFQAKSDLMFITGHKSMKALESYLRSIDAELPEDYSKHFESI